MKTTYTARFDGKEISRKSAKAFTHAFRVTFTVINGGPREVTGFAGSLDLAQKAANGYGHSDKWVKTSDRNVEIVPVF